MVLQKTVDNLKDRPKDERKVVAGGVAIAVIAILILGWGILFIKRIQNGSQEVNLDSGAQGEFNFSSTREAQDAINASQHQGEDFSNLRDDAAANRLRTEGQIYLQEIDGDADQFGTPQ